MEVIRTTIDGTSIIDMLIDMSKMSNVPSLQLLYSLYHSLSLLNSFFVITSCSYNYKIANEIISNRLLSLILFNNNEN